MSTVKKIGLLTGGGDCPGLNAVIRAITKKSHTQNISTIGLLDGWDGLLKERFIELNPRKVSGILPQGGTILGTSRTNILKNDQTIQLAFANFKKLNLDALITIGGEGTLTVASEMFKKGMPIVGVPKTIDNDVNGTDFTFGFDTAVSIATEAIDRLHTTAESHSRVMILEVMGRHAGWIATYSGIAGGADAILIPEYPLSVEEISQILNKRHQTGKKFSIVVVAEGAPLIQNNKAKKIHKNRYDDFGRPLLGGIASHLALELEKECNIDARVTVLGYVQRGGIPTARDRFLATQFGLKAVDLVKNQKFGFMSAIKSAQFCSTSLSEATQSLKTIDENTWNTAKEFFN